jgi:hypothetical protein
MKRSLMIHANIVRRKGTRGHKISDCRKHIENEQLMQEHANATEHKRAHDRISELVLVATHEVVTYTVIQGSQEKKIIWIGDRSLFTYS